MNSVTESSDSACNSSGERECVCTLQCRSKTGAGLSAAGRAEQLDVLQTEGVGGSGSGVAQRTRDWEAEGTVELRGTMR